MVKTIHTALVKLIPDSVFTLVQPDLFWGICVCFFF